jgi:zinc finger protein
VRSYLDEAICPACAHKGMEYNAEQVDLPFMGNSLETLLRCMECGYRHTDFVLTESKEPIRSTYRVAAAEDMSVRVVRSSSGTVRIPELGILIEPGAASEAFVSNVEGILVRVERVLDQLGRDAEDQTMRDRVMDLQDTLAQMREGKAPPVTLVIEDPFGNSRILHEDARNEAMSEEDALLLKTGMHIHDLGDRLREK